MDRGRPLPMGKGKLMAVSGTTRFPRSATRHFNGTRLLCLTVHGKPPVTIAMILSQTDVRRVGDRIEKKFNF